MGTHDGREGRPSLFTPDIRAAVLLALEGFHFRESAATLAGIAPSTLRGWLKIGKDDRKAGNDTPYSRFLADVEQAEARSEQKLLEKAGDAALSLKDMAMIRWLLERRFPRWNDKLMRQLRDISTRVKELEKSNPRNPG